MPYDDTEFVDREFPAPQPGTAITANPARPGAGAGASGRAPTREELDAQMTATQQQLAKLRETHEQLERSKAEIEEKRRRRAEYQTGRAELRDELTRAVGLLEKAEFDSRRDAEQMARSVEGLRGALDQVEGLHEETWTESNWTHELSKALTVIENARLEWNSARLKCPVLSGASCPGPAGTQPPRSGWDTLSFGQLCRLGIAFTWPLLVVGLVAVALFAAALWRR